MARFCTLYSGSSGNCTYIGTAQSGILVDAGVSCKSILAGLSAREIDPTTIKGLFITHEHIDHVKGVRVLLKNINIPLFATAETIKYLSEKNEIPPMARVHTIEDSAQVLGDMSITAFATEHDSLSSVGYRVRLSDERSVSVATDLGHVTDTVQAAITGSDLVLLEANYDDAMLGCSAYPYYLKRRISSDTGHLSNICSAKEAVRLIANGTTRLVLGHLSKENNNPALAYQTISSELQMAKMVEGKDFTLTVAKRSEPSEMIIF